jgi:hypothetical protein
MFWRAIKHKTRSGGSMVSISLTVFVIGVQGQREELGGVTGLEEEVLLECR